MGGREFSSLVQVPSTKDAKLLKALIKLETKLAGITGYNVKITEKPGIPLARLFQRTYSPESCHWLNCPVCVNKEEGKRSRCRASNIVYEAVCLQCLEQVELGVREKEKVGRYIGESSRTLAERAFEHINGAGNLDYENFIVKHWAFDHCDLEKCVSNL